MEKRIEAYSGILFFILVFLLITHASYAHIGWSVATASFLTLIIGLSFNRADYIFIPISACLASFAVSVIFWGEKHLAKDPIILLVVCVFLAILTMMSSALEEKREYDLLHYISFPVAFLSILVSTCLIASDNWFWPDMIATIFGVVFLYIYFKIASKKFLNTEKISEP